MDVATGAAFYVSPRGDDGWSGTRAEPAADGADGPFASIARARDAVRDLKRSGQLTGPLRVWLREGRYPLAAPLVFTPEDSGPITYAAYPGERPILDGGRRIAGWRVEGSGAAARWTVELPEVAADHWYFRQLFVNGARRPRPRLPKDGYYRIAGVPGRDLSAPQFDPVRIFEGADTFRCHPGDIRAWANLTDVEVVVLHYWTEERLPIAAFDEPTGTVTSSRRSMFVLQDDVAARYAAYYVENVAEALRDPGEWYLDRATGRLTYLPLPGEDPDSAEVYAPYAEQLLRLEGHPDLDAYVEHLRFVGLGFEHTEWRQPAGRHELFAEAEVPCRLGVDYAAAPQAACSVAGALSLQGARHCAIAGCRVAHIGGYGVALQQGCRGNDVVGNELVDLGAGGIKLGGTNADGPGARRSGHNRVTDNHIHSAGHVFPSAAGILLTHAFGNDVSHNHIHDLYYSGISCGWVWGYAESVSRDNRIEKNHIHDLGRGLISDMGGIYTLGVQPGTVIRGNLVHDVAARNYGGWGIYLDEGSSHILVEDNICYDMSDTGFNQHYGRENIVRNNIFAFGREGQVSLGRVEAHNGFTCERNILIADRRPLFVGRKRGFLEQAGFVSDLNLAWDVAGEPLRSVNGRNGDDGRWAVQRTFTLDEWRALGQDRHSLVADPRCRDLAGRDFTLNGDAPALAVGFRPIDLSDVGPRPWSAAGAGTEEGVRTMDR